MKTNQFLRISRSLSVSLCLIFCEVPGSLIMMILFWTLSVPPTCRHHNTHSSVSPFTHSLSQVNLRPLSSLWYENSVLLKPNHL